VTAWDRVIPFFAFPPAMRKVVAIERAIRSALQCDAARQGGVEIVVAPDDGSDGYRDLLADLPQVRVLPAASRTGPGAARNRAFAAARGQWLTMLDADDHVCEGYIDLLLQAATSRGVRLRLRAHTLRAQGHPRA
jgi:succinoglycan biosynthesis protein ExoO